MAENDISVHQASHRLVEPRQAKLLNPNKLEIQKDEKQSSFHKTRPQDALLHAEDMTVEQLRGIAVDLGEAITSINRDFQYEIDDRSDVLITRIVNRDTKEVIRQIPPEEMVRIAQELADFVGLLLDEEG